MTALLLVLGLALAVSALASLFEAALLAVPLSHITRLEEEKRGSGPILMRLRERVDEPITALLTLSTLAQVAGAAVGGAIAARLLGDRGLAAFITVLTFGVLLFAELIPKMAGARYCRSLTTPTAHVVRAVVWLMKPLLVTLGPLYRWIGAGAAAMPSTSRAELEAMAEIGRREGALDEQEWEVVTNVINLDQVAVGAVMTPRTSIVALPLEATVEEAKALILEEGHLRMPVYEGTIDRVVGVLLAHDVWRADRDGITEIREIVRTTTFVPGSKPVDDLIREMRHQRIKMGIVVDEYGGTAGLVTLEDLIEEIVGEIQDEHEHEPLPFEEEMEGQVRIRGDVAVWEVNERFEIELPEEVYDTIGGYVFGELGRIAEIGDEVVTRWGCFRVMAMDGRRVERVAFIRDAPAPPPE